MRQGRFGMSSGYNKLMKGYQDINCIRKYTNYKSEIEAQINGLHTKRDSDFCRKCHRIKTDITKKNDELNDCYKKNSISQPLIEDPDIKNFIDKCPTVRECLQKLSPPNKKPVATHQESEKKCARNSGCEQKISPTAEQKARAPPRSTSETSSTIATQGKKPQNLSGQHDNGEKSSAASPVLQTQEKVRSSSNSSEPGGEIPKNEANHQLNMHVQIETETPFPSPALPEARESNTHPTGDLSQKSSDQDSESGNIFHVSDLHKKTLQLNVPDGDGSGGSTPREQTPDGESIGKQAHNDQSVTTGTSGDSTLVQIPPFNEIKVDEKSVSGTFSSEGTENITVDGAVTPSADINGSASSTITTSTMVRNGDPLIGAPHDKGDGELTFVRSAGDNGGVPVSKDSGSEESSYGDTRTEGDLNKTGVDGGSDNETICTEVAGYKLSNKGNLCSKEQRSELMGNNGDESNIFNKIYNMIVTNKDHMINASIPIGIVLLLSLLFKVN
ncbi:VIR protein [Plasmodium vivax]|uniref:VIR protein n=1 Tax=Plasmodium vivax TaxID=5855 RepID=A0A1G4HC59_PLAVI|nr:VIR protein [Plasmodium vivax]